VTFTTIGEQNSDGMLEYAQWANGMGVNYLYVAYSTDERLLQQSGAASPADALKDAELSAVALVYGGIEYAAFIMGTFASVAWNRRQSVITAAFKSQSGLPANITSEATAAILEGKRVNFYGKFATRNDDFTFLYPGAMFGDYRFIDPYINAVWLNSALQLAILNGITLAGRTPYNEPGYTKIRAWAMDAITRARFNGIIDAGVTLTQTQINQVKEEAGRDISTELFANGFVLQIEDPGAQVRVTRESPNCSLWYTYGGSVHRVVLASTAII